MMRAIVSILAACLLVSLSDCARPTEVRSLAETAHPISVALKRSSEALQARFADQRAVREQRATELSLQAAQARSVTAGIEREWRFADNKDSGRKLGILREEDAAILADPLAPVMAPSPVASEPPKLDQSPINVVINIFDQLKQEHSLSAAEIFGFLTSVNDELGKLNDQQEAEARAPQQEE
jgi:hypothetical protein